MKHKASKRLILSFFISGSCITQTGIVEIKNALPHNWSVEYDSHGILGQYPSLGAQSVPAEGQLFKNYFGRSFSNIYFYDDKGNVAHHIQGDLPNLQCTISTHVNADGSQQQVVSCVGEQILTTGKTHQPEVEKQPEERWVALENIIE